MSSLCLFVVCVVMLSAGSLLSVCLSSCLYVYVTDVIVDGRG